MQLYGTFVSEGTLSKEITQYLSGNHKTRESCCRKSGRYTIQIGGTLLSYGSLIPALLVLDGFTPFPHSPFWTKAFQVFAKASLFICFGTFGAFGYVKLGNHIFIIDSRIQNSQQNNNRTTKCARTIFKIAHVLTSLIMGFLSRLPGVGVASLVNAGKKSENALMSRLIWEVIAGIGTAGPECLSAYLTLGALGKKFDQVFCGKDYIKKFQMIRKNICDAILGIIQKHFMNSIANRKRLEELLNIHSQEGSFIQLGAITVKELFNIILIEEHRKIGRNHPSRAKIVSEVAIAAFTSYAAMVLLLQNTILSRLAFDSWTSEDTGWKWPAAAVSASVLGYVAIEHTFKAGCSIFNRFVRSKKFPYHKTFAEVYYPKTNFLLNCLATLQIVGLYGIIYQSAKSSTNIREADGMVILVENCLALFLLVYDALKELLIEAGLQNFASSRCSDPEIRWAYLLFKKLDDIKMIVQNSQNSDLSLFLKTFNKVDDQVAMATLSYGFKNTEDFQNCLNALSPHTISSNPINN